MFTFICVLISNNQIENITILIAVKGWGLEYLHRYYPKIVVKVPGDDDAHLILINILNMLIFLLYLFMIFHSNA